MAWLHPLVPQSLWLVPTHCLASVNISRMCLRDEISEEIVEEQSWKPLQRYLGHYSIFLIHDLF